MGRSTKRSLNMLAILGLCALGQIGLASGIARAAQDPTKPTAPVVPPPNPLAPPPVVNPPSPGPAAGAATDANLFLTYQPILSEHILLYLKNHPQATVEMAITKAVDQLTRIAKTTATNGGKLSDTDLTLLAGAVDAIFNAFQANPAPAAPATPAPAAPAPAPGAAPAPAANAGNFITGDTLTYLQNELTRMDAVMQNAALDNPQSSGPATVAQRTKYLTDFTQKPTTRAGDGTFLASFNKRTGQSITNYQQLSPADQQAVTNIINQVLGTAAETAPVVPPGGPVGATPPTKPGGATQSGSTTDPLTTDADSVLQILGDVLPQFAPFEPLAQDAANAFIPVVERWQPFRNFFSKFGTRQVYMSGGTTMPPASASGRYIIVNP